MKLTERQMRSQCVRVTGIPKKTATMNLKWSQTPIGMQRSRESQRQTEKANRKAQQKHWESY